MLWLALHFPRLPIEHQADEKADTPHAVVLQEGNHRRILVCNAAAAARGVRPGQALRSAFDLVPALTVSDHDEQRQRAHLEQLTLWALHYSSLVSAEPPDALLLEIGASLQLFGNIDRLQQKIHQDIRQQHLSLSTAIAPTPSAALLFARAGVHRQLLEGQSLKQELASVPINWLPLDTFTQQGLHQSGLRTLGELNALPPASLTRRFGSHCTELLYRLDGRLPEPRHAYRPPEHFFQNFDLALEAPETGALAFPLNRLMRSLGGFLRAHDLGLRQLQLHLYHHRGPASKLVVRFLDATADTRHLHQIAVERLGQLNIRAPVIRLGLESLELAELTREGGDLFQRARSGNHGVEQLMDRLAARLGRQALYTPLGSDDHRPEKAWVGTLLGQLPPSTQQSPRPSSADPLTHKPAHSRQWISNSGKNRQRLLQPESQQQSAAHRAATAKSTPPSDNEGLPRPLWLLREPRPLYQAVTLHTHAERIENGWWDDIDVRRDYYIASTADGSYYWVYWQRRPFDERLYVHGIFA